MKQAIARRGGKMVMPHEFGVVLRSTPASSKWVANAWRRLWMPPCSLLGNAGALLAGVKDALRRLDRDMNIRVLAGIEKPSARTHGPPDHAELIKQFRRQQAQAVLRALPCSIRKTIRWLSMSPAFRVQTSDTRNPAA